MNDTLSLILQVFRQAWVAITVVMVTIAILAMISHILRTLSASVIGAQFWVYESLASIGTVLVVIGIAFLGIPPIVSAVSTSIPNSPGCGPIAELGFFASGLIAAIVSLRMLIAFFRTIGGAALGGTAQISQAMIEASEALFGMLLAGVVIPLVGMFIGVCN